MHDWSDESVDWGGIWKGCSFFYKYYKMFARPQCFSTKEKYGTMRIEYYPFDATSKIGNIYQLFIFNMLAIIMNYRWYHLREELLHDCEFDDYLYKWVKKLIKREDTWIKVSSHASV